MKFTIIAAAFAAFLATTVSAQSSDPSACTLCLQQALKQLPACANVEAPAAGSAVSSAYAACLCSSLSGSWIDSCSSADKCGAAVSALKSAYGPNIEAAGLTCGPGGQASFTSA
ncbi:hypothetical protein EC991_010485 [Linnemannia zychae]|nr:hypothetical protein EC991_010485 [Linnemannia zychae]